jgi:4-hydroxy-tetrahydrodipicolinate synthase
MSEFIKEMTGPVIPLPTPFTQDEEVDYASLGNYVKFLVDNGINNVMTTIGTSRFNLVTHEEIRGINEVVVANSGNAKTIVTNSINGGLKHAIEFGKHAESIGADYYLVFFPERHYGEDNTYNFFKKLTDATNIKILIHEMPMRNGMGGGTVQYSLPLLERLFEIENMVGVKEEALDAEYSNMLVEALNEKAIIIGAGGGMSRYLNRDYDRGSKAFLGGIGNFYPQLEIDFYYAITNGNREEASRIVNEIELPYFEKVVPIGWHPSLKAALALKGLMPKFERTPMKQIADAELEQMRQILTDNNWL